MKNENDTSKRIPSYAGINPAKEALAIFQRINAKHIDRDFIVGNGLATAPNSHRIINLYKWLGIIDEEGNVPENISAKLRLLGEERDEFIKKLILESYGDLFQTINIERAKFQEVVNFFITKYNFSSSSAILATNLFSGLCEEYKIEISDELKGKPRKPRERSSVLQKLPRKFYYGKEKKPEPSSINTSDSESMYPMIVIIKSNDGYKQEVPIKGEIDIDFVKDQLEILKKRLKAMLTSSSVKEDLTELS